MTKANREGWIQVTTHISLDEPDWSRVEWEAMEDLRLQYQRKRGTKNLAKIGILINPERSWEEIKFGLRNEAHCQWLEQKMARAPSEHELEDILFRHLAVLSNNRFKPLTRQLTIYSERGEARIDIVAVDMLLNALVLIELKRRGGITTGIEQLEHYLYVLETGQFQNGYQRLETAFRENQWPYYGLLITHKITRAFSIADDCPLPLGGTSYYDLRGGMEINPALNELWECQLETSAPNGKNGSEDHADINDS